jgi:hypothetical protein
VLLSSFDGCLLVYFMVACISMVAYTLGLGGFGGFWDAFSYKVAYKFVPVFLGGLLINLGVFFWRGCL